MAQLDHLYLHLSDSSTQEQPGKPPTMADACSVRDVDKRICKAPAGLESGIFVQAAIVKTEVRRNGDETSRHPHRRAMAVAIPNQSRTGATVPCTAWSLTGGMFLVTDKPERAWHLSSSQPASQPMTGLDAAAA